MNFSYKETQLAPLWAALSSKKETSKMLGIWIWPHGLAMQLFGSTTWSAAWDSPISRCHRPSDGSRAAVHVPRGSRWAITAAVSSTAVSVVKSQSRASKMKRKRNWEDFNAAAELGDVALTKEIFWEMCLGTWTVGQEAEGPVHGQGLFWK